MNMVIRMAPLLAPLLLATAPAAAFTQPFTFHCTGNACRSMGFLDEGLGCLVYTNRGARAVRLTLGPDGRVYDLSPGQTLSPIADNHCYGYYDGGERATFLTAPR
jgi:hypothetical protein